LHIAKIVSRCLADTKAQKGGVKQRRPKNGWNAELDKLS
jgi:hypothetical protein